MNGLHKLLEKSSMTFLILIEIKSETRDESRAYQEIQKNRSICMIWSEYTWSSKINVLRPSNLIKKPLYCYKFDTINPKLYYKAIGSILFGVVSRSFAFFEFDSFLYLLAAVLSCQEKRLRTVLLHCDNFV